MFQIKNYLTSTIDVDKSIMTTINADHEAKDRFVDKIQVLGPTAFVKFSAKDFKLYNQFNPELDISHFEKVFHQSVGMALFQMLSAGLIPELSDLALPKADDFAKRLMVTEMHDSHFVEPVWLDEALYGELNLEKMRDRRTQCGMVFLDVSFNVCNGKQIGMFSVCYNV
tara:strand:+ start:6408 stop:6914 length:507 start_codon:yes stop_codon:yes gene_type:complete